MRLVALLEAAQDRDGVLDARLADIDLLEAALERGILLDELAVLVERGCTDEPQFAAREHGLEHVGRRDGALASARAHERVEFVDEGDDLPVGVVDLLEDRLEPFLELAAVFGTGDERGEVESDEALVLERVGDVPRDDALGEAFHDRRLADAGFTDEDRVVLGPSGEHLAHPSDLRVAPDDRVELAGARDRGEIHPVLLERGLLLLVARRCALHVGHVYSCPCATSVAIVRVRPRVSSMVERSPDDQLRVALRPRSRAERDHVAGLARSEHSATRAVEQFVGEGGFEFANPRFQFGDVVLELEHAPDAFEAHSLTAESSDLPQLGDIPHRVAAGMPSRAPGAHETEPVVLPERLRVHPGELRGHGDGEERRVLIHDRHPFARAMRSARGFSFGIAFSNFSR